jgi:hypothetical protein
MRVRAVHWRVSSASLRMFELAPKTPEEAERALKEFDVQVVGPHPRQSAGVIG